MKTSLLILPLLLTGCVTITMPPVQQQAVQNDKPVSTCPVYQRPSREALLTSPDLDPSEMADLEAVGLKLAKHIRRLYDYIDAGEREEAKSYSRYLENCKTE